MKPTVLCSYPGNGIYNVCCVSYICSRVMDVFYMYSIQVFVYYIILLYIQRGEWGNGTKFFKFLFFFSLILLFLSVFICKLLIILNIYKIFCLLSAHNRSPLRSKVTVRLSQFVQGCSVIFIHSFI